MALTLTATPSVPMLAPPGFTPSMSVSALDVLPDVPFGSQVTVTRTTLTGDTTTLEEGTDYSYNGVTDEVFFFIPLGNDDVISFSITPDYSVTDLSTQFSDLGVAPAEGSNLRDKQLLQMARDLDARILALGGESAGGGTSAGVSSLVVGSTSYDGTIQLFAGTGLSFLEGSSSFQIQLDSDIVAAPGNIVTLNTNFGTLQGEVDSLTTTVGSIYQVPDSSAATVGHVLTVNNSNQAEWQAPTGGSGGGGATNISGLDDVTLTGLTNGDILVAEDGYFVNQAPNFLTSGDVSAVALDNDYNSLTNLPTIPTTSGDYAFTTDRPSTVLFNAPNNETLASGYVWRWTGSQFKPARLDIADVNTAGNQPLADLMDGTTETVPEYTSGDAAKVLTVSAGGSGLEWASAAAGSGPRIWSCYFDNTSGTQGEFDRSGNWSFSLSSSDRDTLLDKFGTGEIEVGTSVGSYSSGVFTISETGTYRISWNLNVGSYQATGAQAKSSDIVLLRNSDGGAITATDEVLRRSMEQFMHDDVSSASFADHAVSQYSHSSLVSLTANDEIGLFLTGDVGIQTVLAGSWMIEKVG